jgi:hypothetical protein
MTALLAALMLLCGLPVGFVIGLVVGTRMYRAAVREDDVDYSGGV